MGLTASVSIHRNRMLQELSCWSRSWSRGPTSSPRWCAHTALRAWYALTTTFLAYHRLSRHLTMRRWAPASPAPSPASPASPPAPSNSSSVRRRLKRLRLVFSCSRILCSRRRMPSDPPAPPLLSSSRDDCRSAPSKLPNAAATVCSSVAPLVAAVRSQRSHRSSSAARASGAVMQSMRAVSRSSSASSAAAASRFRDAADDDMATQYGEKKLLQRGQVRPKAFIKVYVAAKTPQQCSHP